MQTTTVRTEEHISIFRFICCRGKCEPYIGNVCSEYIGAGQQIFISENRTQRGFETKLTQSWITVQPVTSSKCRKFALKALCYYFFPPCQEDNVTPNLICRKDCEMLEAQICSKEFQYAKTMPIGGEIIPECVNLPVKQESCLELGLNREYLPLNLKDRNYSPPKTFCFLF